MIIVAANFVLKKNRPLKLIVFLGVLSLFTQGGGLITYILQSKEAWYWQNSKVIEINNTAKRILQPLVIEQ